jgi:tetratricopeptide (TPR) repeat protein
MTEEKKPAGGEAEESESEASVDESAAPETEEERSEEEAEPSKEPNKPPPAPTGEPEGGQRMFVALLVAGLAVALGVVLYLRSGKADGSGPAGNGASVVEKLEAAGRPGPAKLAKEACTGGMTCACRQATAHAALDGDLHADALAELAADPACEKDPKSQGMEAEALARAGKQDEAVAKANEVLKASPEDPFATYALAHVAWSKGDVQTVLQQAPAAVRRGRGAPAHLLSSLLYFRTKAYEPAKVELQEMLKLDPNDIDALYNLALIAQIENHYREAREGYLKVLAIAPKHADSRYNLGIMTHSVGAIQETRHNLERLKEIVPADDERVKKLEALLAGPPPNPGQGMVLAPASAAPSAAPSPVPAPSSAPLDERR